MLHDLLPAVEFPLPAPVSPTAGRDLRAADTRESDNPTVAGYRALMGRTRSLVTLTASRFAQIEELRTAARHDVTVLLVGETGSGKTYLARLLHELSPRSTRTFCHVACGALPGELIASELFGHVRGAFTGADRAHDGKFAAAGSGTLLLDEIDVLPLAAQAKLLRVIESGEFEPVGSNDTRRSQARLIVASNRNLAELAAAGQFRLDLFYRLNVLRFELPPLRERTADIPYLARQFALAHGKTHGIEIERIEPDFFAALQRHAWPGNVRELENAVRRAVLYCRAGRLAASDLPADVLAAPHSALTAVAPSPAVSATAVVANHGTLEAQLEPVERQIIAAALRSNGGHRLATAQQLGISRVTLFNKMRRLGLLGGRSAAAAHPVAVETVA